MIDRNHMSEQRAAFVWSRLRKRFHAPDCRWAFKILLENRRAGNSPDPLDGEPRSPCKVCQPSGGADDVIHFAARRVAGEGHERGARRQRRRTETEAFYPQGYIALAQRLGG